MWKDMSVFVDLGIGVGVFATAINSFASLYNPMVVTYGWNAEPVMLSSI